MPTTGPNGIDIDAETFGSRLRAERQRQGVGVRELSRRIEVSASMISQIERGRVMPSVNTLFAITTVLGISLDALLGGGAAAIVSGNGKGAEGSEDGRAAGSPLVQRHDAGQSVGLASGVRWELLTPEPDTAVEFLRTIYAPGSESTPPDALIRHGGHEYGTVTEGRLGVTVGFETFQLEAGDSISFASTTPHRLFNDGPERAVAIWFVVARRGAAV